MTTHADTMPASAMLEPTGVEPGARVYHNKLGMWVFLLSEVMFFTALIGSYLILRFAHPEAWPAPGEMLNIPVTAVNTFILTPRGTRRRCAGGWWPRS
jgi:heme/copper-type cytochrome/quinol oxidase subunit 3